MHLVTLSAPMSKVAATDALLRGEFSYFDISPGTGFLDLDNTAYRLPQSLPESEWENVLAAARSAWPNGRPVQNANSKEEGVEAWRSHVRNMRVHEAFSADFKDNTAFLRRAYVVLSMIGHFYIYGKIAGNTSHPVDQAHDPSFIPRPLAIPWLQVSRALGLNPVLSYAAEVVWNCTLDATSTVQGADQIHALETFTNHPSEIAFIEAPARVEFEGAVALTSIFEILLVLSQSTGIDASCSVITHELQKMESALKKMRGHLLVLKKECDPSHFYWTQRPWIAGSGPDGWTYQLAGDSQLNLKLGGSTAGSSSLLQTLDSFLGLEFGESHLAFRRSMQDYMPQGHRLFIKILETLSCQDAMSLSLQTQISIDHAASPFRTFVKQVYTTREESTDQATQLVLAYNNVLRALKEFRDEHFRIVSLFVINQASKQPPGAEAPKATTQANEDLAAKAPLKGTGGSDLAKLLKGYRDSSQAALFTMN